ncbi:MAG: hypothetical protein HYY24_03750 [Verrucomicrobia bacterium]|nr:hypothetical protein [Verrucomicrobiota bacterium]
MNWLNKDELAVKLERFPLLRQMLFEFWFRVIVLCGLLGVIFLALFLPKMWVTSPAGFLPVVKVSGLDFAQAWSLKRTARQAMAAGRYEDAAYAWQSAFANNPGNPKLARGALENFLHLERPGKTAGSAIQQALWLLRLTGTNTVDLELAARVFEKNRFYEFVLDLLDARKDSLSPALETAALKSLFHLGQMDEFARRWDLGGERLKADAELPLYHAAYLAGAGPVGTQAEGKQRLDSVLSDPARRTLANRLLLLVAARRTDATLYEDALHRLEEHQEDALLDHVGFWRLLAATGRKDEAVQLAQAYPHPPSAPAETVQLAQTYAALGLRDYALEFLQRYAPKFAYAERVWLTYAQLLMEAKQWDDLRELALRIRREDTVRDRLAGFSFYLEGRAELALDRKENAEAAFQKVAGARFENRALGLTTARNLLRLGDPAAARDVLLKLGPGAEGDFTYWNFLFAAANELKDTDLMLSSVSQAYKLRPNDVPTMNNYAATLLIHRLRPDEIIKLTVQLRARDPRSLAATINHAFALLLNQRAREAEALLRTVDIAKLIPAHASLYHLGLFDACVAQQKFDAAWRASGKINLQHLYPNQVKWLEETRRRLPPRAGE